MSDLAPHVERLIERLRVHATSTGTGFRPDPNWVDWDEDEYDPTPGESGQWSYADQYAIANAERALLGTLGRDG